MNFNELERIAYITGDTASAKLFAQLADLEAQLADAEDTNKHYDKGYEDGYATGKEAGYDEARERRYRG